MTATTAPTDGASTHPLAAAAAAAGVLFQHGDTRRPLASICGAPSQVRIRPARWFLAAQSLPSRWVLLVPSATLAFDGDLMIDVYWTSPSPWRPTGFPRQGRIGDWTFLAEAHDAMVEVLAELDRLALEVPPLPDELAARAVAP